MKDLPVIFVNSHPIQYFAPLYRYLNQHRINTTCWYCSDETIKGHVDREFNSMVKWDIPVLDGYTYRFFRNYSWKPSFYNGFFGLFNPGMIVSLFKTEKSVVVVHGWAYLTNVMVVFFARIAGHRVCLRAESPLNQELRKTRKNIVLKKILLRGVLFPFVHKFLFIGEQNKAFYRFYGVSPDKLVFAPYAVDNERFQNASKVLSTQRLSIRQSLGIHEEAKVILFTAKYIGKKRPMDLIAAYQQLEMEDKFLIMAGDGELRKQMESFISDNSISNVILTGFVNQLEIEKYYAIADVFVLCSGEGETWGLSVNEAMNFDLPVVVSATCGCAEDLVDEGRNGYVVKEGDVEALRNAIGKAFALDGTVGRKIIDRFSFSEIASSINKLQVI